MDKRCLIFLLALILFLLQPVLVFADPASQAARIQGPLHTDGTKILDSNGKVVFFRGVNVSGMEWGAGTRGHGRCPGKYGCYWVPRVDEIENIAGWGFNMVRIPISWANLEPQPGRCCNPGYVSALDRVVEELAKKNVAVIFSMHQWDWSPDFKAKRQDGKLVHGNGEPPWLYPDSWFENNPIAHGKVNHQKKGRNAASREFFMNSPKKVLHGDLIQKRYVDVWIFVARHFKQFPNVVGADLFNEPYGNQVAPDSLEKLYLETARAVSKENPDLLLIFEMSLSHPKMEHPEIFLNDPAFKGKAVYSMHVYSGTPEKFVSKAAKQYAIARKWNVPFWIGEFHCFVHKDRRNSTFGFNVDQAETKQIMDYMKRAGINWTYWAYSQDAQPIEVNGKLNMDLVKALQSGF